MDSNLINYLEDVGMPTANLMLIQIFLNSVIFTPGAQCAMTDIENFYLMTPLKWPEFAKIKHTDIPAEMIKEYNLHDKASPDRWVYIKVIDGMYGLPQAGSLGHVFLEDHLNKEEYFQGKMVPGFWKYSTWLMQFTLVVDDFVIKFISNKDLDHLNTMLEKNCNVTLDKDSKEYVKTQLDWDYKRGEVHLLMKSYLDKGLHQFAPWCHAEAI